MSLNFGVPNQREKREEKYPTIAVMTLEPTGEGLGRKMHFNDTALALLGVTETKTQLSFSFSGNDVFIVNTSGIDNCAGLNVGKTTNGFSDKKHYNFIKGRIHQMDDASTLELFFEETENEFNGNKVFKLIPQNAVNSVAFMEANTDPLTEEDVIVREYEVEDHVVYSEEDAVAQYTSDEVESMESEQAYDIMSVNQPQENQF